MVSCSRFPNDDAIPACGFEESTLARYIHLKWKSRTLYLFQTGVSKATYYRHMIYLMHIRIPGLATNMILFDAHQPP